jgi:hypothetical protein
MELGSEPMELGSEPMELGSEPMELGFEPMELAPCLWSSARSRWSWLRIHGARLGVKTLLENAQKTISPLPQRIIWCYGQWQPVPSYFDLLRTMPGIEFNKDIPDDIDNGDYLDVSQRNLIILDDLVAQSSKDKRIADLFTKGSHHRNLLYRYCSGSLNRTKPVLVTRGSISFHSKNPQLSI